MGWIPNKTKKRSVKETRRLKNMISFIWSVAWFGKPQANIWGMKVSMWCNWKAIHIIVHNIKKLYFNFVFHMHSKINLWALSLLFDTQVRFCILARGWNQNYFPKCFSFCSSVPTSKIKFWTGSKKTIKKYIYIYIYIYIKIKLLHQSVWIEQLAMVAASYNSYVGREMRLKLKLSAVLVG